MTEGKVALKQVGREEAHRSVQEVTTSQLPGLRANLAYVPRNLFTHGVKDSYSGGM